MDHLNALAGALPVVLLVAVYGGLNRAWGDDHSFNGEKAVLIALAAVAGYLTGGLTGALFALAWLIWRAIPFFGGSQAPTRASEFAAAFVKHALVLVPALVVAYCRHLDIKVTGAAFSGFVVAAVALAVIYGRRKLKADAAAAAGAITAVQGNEQLKRFYGGIEIAMGAALGAAIAATLHFAVPAP